MSTTENTDDDSREFGTIRDEILFNYDKLNEEEKERVGILTEIANDVGTDPSYVSDVVNTHRESRTDPTDLQEKILEVYDEMPDAGYSEIRRVVGNRFDESPTDSTISTAIRRYRKDWRHEHGNAPIPRESSSEEGGEAFTIDLSEDEFYSIVGSLFRDNEDELARAIISDSLVEDE